MSRTLRTILSLLLVGSLAPLAVYGAGGSSSSLPTQTDVPTDPKVLAANNYNRAIKGRDKAWELEEQRAAATSDKERAKLDKKIAKQYKSALNAIKQSVQADPSMFQSQSTLGYLLRKTGDFDASIKAYDRSLAINPRYTEAIEYRAEAHLALGRIDEVKDAYMTLFQVDRPKADQLMTAMEGWCESNPEDEGFATWVADRAGVAATTASLTRPGSAWGGR